MTITQLRRLIREQIQLLSEDINDETFHKRFVFGKGEKFPIFTEINVNGTIVDWSWGPVGKMGKEQRLRCKTSQQAMELAQKLCDSLDAGYVEE